MHFAQNGLWPGAVALLAFPRRGRGMGDKRISSAHSHFNLLKIIRLVTARTTTSTAEYNVRNVFELPKRSLEMILESEKNIRT